MIYVMIVAMYIPTFINYEYMNIKENMLHLEFDKKLKNKGYEKTDDHDLVSLIADKVVNRGEYAARILLSLFPICNLIPFMQIMTKKLDREYKTILNSLDNQEILELLEEQKYIFNQNTIFEVEENITSKMDEMNSQHIEISKNDSLNQLKQKKELLDEMIYLQSLKEKEFETDNDLTRKNVKIH